MARTSPGASTPPPRTGGLAKKGVWLRSAILFVFGAILSIAGMVGLFDTSKMLLARNWPVVTAHLDACDATLRSGRYDDYWDFSARWRFGPGEAQHLEENWTPPGAPRYPHHNPREIVTAGQMAEIKARYCNAPETTQLRVSPTFSGQAVMNTDVTDGAWKGSLAGTLITLLGGPMLIAVAISGWRSATGPKRAKRKR
ncbi:hypothetical protein WJ542_25765 [Paraburkholderia sp. B3]|uniref:hypothetical protein n=1 Tax=Paraburkholderia sp. B3 TaxID=3134791 RepID=UPI003982340D